MSDAKVGVIIEAEDQASGIIRGVQTSLGNLNKSVKDLAPVFKTMAVAGTVAMGAIGGAVYKSLQSADEATKVTAQLNAVLKSTNGVAGMTAESVLNLSKSLQKQTTFSDEAVTSASNLLLTFTKIGKDISPDATKTVLDMSVALGQDTKSSAIQLGKALNDPILGVTALRKVGVNFTKENQDMIASLVESGKTIEAQKFILNELATEFGGSAKAQAETFGGRIQQVKNQIDDLTEAVGMALMPHIQKLTEAITPVVTKVVEWAEANPQMITSILATATALAGLLIVVGTLGIALPAIATGLALVFSPLGLLVIGFTALIATLIIFRNHVGDVFDLINQKTGLVTLLKDAWSSITTQFTDFLLPALIQLWESLTPLKPFLEAMAQVIGVMLVVAIGGITMAISGWVQILTFLLTAVTKVGTYISDILVGSINDLIESVGWAIDKMKELWNWLKKVDIGGAVSSAGSKIKKIASRVVDDAVISPSGNVVSTAPNDWLIATKNPASLGGGGTTIVNINGGNYLDRNAGLMLGDQIIQSLRQQMRL